MLVDVGAGDGRYVLAVARSRPTTLVIGVEPSTDALRRVPRHLARQPLPNAAFLVEAVERLPSELAGIADEVRVHFPWGALLRGCVGGDDSVLAALAALVKSGGDLTLLLSLIERDAPSRAPSSLGLSGPLDDQRVTRIEQAFGRHGLGMRESRPATWEDVREARLSWGKRLGVGVTRPGSLLRFRRSPARP
ncbi:MAG TPA: methyltransferase domain-containing protein [Gaiellaceae bacterium]|nr:methyltransferase domain-containing protein [Gaiellaceae bacterium]